MNDSNNNLDPKIKEQVEKLQLKYEVMGQDLSSYLDGLLHSNYLTYWDYIHLDTLMSLQTPRTDFPDENIFIIYHQITELYFKLILNEMDQLCYNDNINGSEFLLRLKRVNRYVQHLCDSFEVMIDGMDKEQFLQFRMALLPASGFQSAQIRKLEIMSTYFNNLLKTDQDVKEGSIKDRFEQLYWHTGATELASGKKTLTLKMFIKKYKKELIELGEDMTSRNLWHIFTTQLQDCAEYDEIINALREMDKLVNVEWRLSHYKSAFKYLNKKPKEIAATGGTNWQKYLPPKVQQTMFFPELWSDGEKENWGKIEMV